MKSNIEDKNFSAMLYKYKFRNDVPDETRKFIAEHKRKNLNNILKEVNNYSIWTGVIVSIYFLLKKTGLKLSLAGIKIILVSGITVSVIVPGTFFSYKLYKNYNSPAVKTETSDIVVLSDDKSPKIEDKPELAAIKNKNTEAASGQSNNNILLKINKFETFGFEEKIDAEKQFLSLFAELLGNEKVILFSEKKNSKAKYIMTGRIIKMGDKYSFSVKIVNTSDSKIEFIESRNFDNIEDIDVRSNNLFPDLKNLKIFK